MPNRGANEGNFLVEIEGIASVRAMNVRGGKITQTPTLTPEGNRGNPHVGGGNYEVDDITIKQATALNQMGIEFFGWLYGYIKRINFERRTVRVIELDEDGATPIHVWEYTNCVPVSIEPDDRSARGQNAASFTIVIKPEDILPL
jgi:phage tail-like protein